MNLNLPCNKIMYDFMLTQCCANRDATLQQCCPFLHLKASDEPEKRYDENDYKEHVKVPSKTIGNCLCCVNKSSIRSSQKHFISVVTFAVAQTKGINVNNCLASSLQLMHTMLMRYLCINPLWTKFYFYVVFWDIT